MLALEVTSCPIEGSPVFRDDSGTLRHLDIAWRRAKIQRTIVCDHIGDPVASRLGLRLIVSGMQCQLKTVALAAYAH